MDTKKNQSGTSRQTGNWSGTQGKTERPGNEGGKQAGQREFTEEPLEVEEDGDRPSTGPSDEKR
jgi:hypothetical protein